VPDGWLDVVLAPAAALRAPVIVARGDPVAW
jgi:hypothetical protein